MPTANKCLSFRPDPPVYDALVAKAAEEGRSAYSLLYDAVRAYLGMEPGEPVRSPRGRKPGQVAAVEAPESPKVKAPKAKPPAPIETVTTHPAVKVPKKIDTSRYDAWMASEKAAGKA